MLARYAISTVLGVCITFAILFGMQSLIATAKKGLDESGQRHFVDFVRVERQEVSQQKSRRLEKPIAPDAMPELPQPTTDAVSPNDVVVAIAPVSVSVDVEISGPGMAVSDGEYLPIVKVAPAYPARALNRGIEGYVTVEFTVTSAGTVKDVVVIDADPEGVFEKVAIAAALKFKYKPRVVNGEPITVRGVKNIFRFNLEN